MIRRYVARKISASVKVGSSEVPCDIENAAKARIARADFLEPAGRKPAEIDREDHDAHQAEPERGRGVEDQPEGRDQRIRPAIDLSRREHA